jgi:hypothetical protein
VGSGACDSRALTDGAAALTAAVDDGVRVGGVAGGDWSTRRLAGELAVRYESIGRTELLGLN